LRKDRKDYYMLPGSYRPVALENSLAKLVEDIVADRINSTAEEHNLLPWNQMGALKGQSALSAIDLLIACILDGVEVPLAALPERPVYRQVASYPLSTNPDAGHSNLS